MQIAICYWSFVLLTLWIRGRMANNWTLKLGKRRGILAAHLPEESWQPLTPICFHPGRFICNIRQPTMASAQSDSFDLALCPKSGEAPSTRLSPRDMQSSNRWALTARPWHLRGHLYSWWRSWICTMLVVPCLLNAAFPIQSFGPHRCETVLLSPFYDRGGRVGLWHP